MQNHKIFLCLGLLLSTVLKLSAAVDSAVDSAVGEKRISFAYDVNFNTLFDNREFAYSKDAYLKSMTLFGSRLAPAVGIDIDRGRDISHSLMVGLDLFKQFGRSPIASDIAGEDVPETARRQNTWDIFEEITLYYKLQARVGRDKETFLELNAGVFPHRFVKGEFSEVFRSDSLAFFDNNIEGILFSVTHPKVQFELGCDWLGQKGDYRRERFIVFGYLDVPIVKWSDFKLSGYMYHYAGSGQVRGVVDNVLFNPRFTFKFEELLPLQKFQLTLGSHIGLQRDRMVTSKMTVPVLGNVDLELRNWNVGIINSFSFGQNMMPMYDNYDAGDVKFGNHLYLGSPMYQMGAVGCVGLDGAGKVGIYDRLEVYYQPKIASFLDLKIGAVMHFNQKFLGWQQQISLILDLSPDTLNPYIRKRKK